MKIIVELMMSLWLLDVLMLLLPLGQKDIIGLTPLSHLLTRLKIHHQISINATHNDK